MYNDSWVQIADKICNQVQNIKKGPYIICINGVDTSGKTRFSKDLVVYLNSKQYKTVLIHLDDFHNPSNIRRMGNDEIDAYITNAFNLELLEDRLLKPLKAKGKIDTRLALLDLNTDEYSNIKHYYADEDTIIILEGVLLYREPINKYLDYRIFLDITFQEVLKRAGERDLPIYGEAILDKYKTKYIPIQKWYLENYKPKEISDLIVDNNDYNNPFVVAER